MNRPFLDTLTVLKEQLGDLTGQRVVDIGAGSGRITRELALLGADAVGVEPLAAAIAAAREAGGGPYVQAPAEATGLPADHFDLALFSYSLHHVGDLGAGLEEACRITRAGGRIAVVEPEAPDPLYPVMRYIDDESPAYDRARAALQQAVASGLLAFRQSRQFASKQYVETPAQLVEEMQAVDPDRRLADEDRPAFEAAFAGAHQRDGEGGFIPYWSRMDVFTRQ